MVKDHGALKSTIPVSVLSGKRKYDKDNAKVIIFEDAVIHFAEWILRIHASTEGRKGPINSIKFATRDSQGMWKTYDVNVIIVIIIMYSEEYAVRL